MPAQQTIAFEEGTFFCRSRVFIAKPCAQDETLHCKLAMFHSGFYELQQSKHLPPVHYEELNNNAGSRGFAQMPLTKTLLQRKLTKKFNNYFIRKLKILLMKILTAK